jgi:hypothetical protein
MYTEGASPVIFLKEVVNELRLLNPHILPNSIRLTFLMEEFSRNRPFLLIQEGG